MAPKCLDTWGADIKWAGGHPRPRGCTRWPFLRESGSARRAGMHRGAAS